MIQCLKGCLHALVICVLTLFCIPQAHAALRVDIYGPGQNLVSLALAAPLKGSNVEATDLGRGLQKVVEQNLSFLPFLRLTDPKAVLGGTVMAGAEPPALDFKRFQLAGADLLVTAEWPNGDSGTKSVMMRVFETNTGEALFGKEYAKVTSKEVPAVADRFCADLLEILTGNGAFFRSTIAFTRTSGKMSANVWLTTPTGRNVRQITNLSGKAMSPSWSRDGRFIVFSHINASSHGLGVWESGSGRVKRVSFPNSVVISPTFTPSNQIAVALSNGRYPAIFLLNRAFKKERILAGGDCINVSPSFDSSGSKMAFTSSRLGGPQIFISGGGGGGAARVSMNGGYNTEPNISPDGTLVAYSRMTSYGNRIFVQDMVTGEERQVSFGPGSDEQPSFCADSYFIAFTSSRGGGRHIYLTTRQGGDAKQIPTGGGAAFPRWNTPAAPK